MQDFPILVVKGSESGLGFFDAALPRFSNHRVCHGAVNALQVLDAAPAAVVILEPDVGEMSGAELASAIRDVDAESERYTYIIMVGNVPPETVESDEFRASIDVISGTRRPDVLTQLAIAGGRVADRIEKLHTDNESLQNLCNLLRRGQLLDPLTGLGNRSFAEQALADTIRQIESRGGAACFLMISIQNYDVVKESYDTKIAGELVLAVSQRVQGLVRPLDTVTYFGPGQFALILIQPTIEQCTAACYRRIYDGVKLKSYSTSAGFQPVEIAMSICAGTAETGPPNPAVMIETATELLKESQLRGSIAVRHIS